MLLLLANVSKFVTAEGRFVRFLAVLPDTFLVFERGGPFPIGLL